MNVLIWTNAFPRYSETFVRDPIFNLLDAHINVLIYSGKIKNLEEKQALKGYGSYNLLDRIYDHQDFIPSTWRKRRVNAVAILITSCFNGNFKYYIRSLNSKYGSDAISYRLFYFVHFLLKNRIDIIHTHFGTNGKDAAIFKKLGMPLKLITTFHGYDIRLGQQEKKDFYLSLFQQVDHVIAISKYNRNYLIDFGLDNSKIVELPNGIDTTVFFKNQNRAKTNTIKFLTVARLVPEKALDIAIQAFALNLKKNPDLNIELHIIGDGPLRQNLETLIKDLDIAEYVFLKGIKNTNEVCIAMQASDIFLLSSRTEILPTVLLEAQACELPILATNVGSVREMIANGIIVNPNSVEAMVEGLIEMVEKRKEWSTMGKDGRDYVKENFEIKKITQRLIEVYNE